jgi:lipoprotein-anchoring transpeptidase ErfK/SrfK
MCGGHGGITLRINISLIAITFVVAAPLGQAAAQYYPQPSPPQAGQGQIAPQPLPSLGGAPVSRPPADIGDRSAPDDVTGAVRSPAGAAAAPPPEQPTVIAALPPEDQPERGPPKELPPQLRRQLVDYVTKEPAGTIIIDTPNTYLYLILGNGKALRYGIGVGREGFTWSGSERISRMSQWPDWFPPKEMIERQPYLPRFMAGGEGNPLGARAIYLGNTIYRIHGTNMPETIGQKMSSGCIRMLNADVIDLYSRVEVGTKTVVLPNNIAVVRIAPPASAAQFSAPHTYDLRAFDIY